MATALQNTGPAHLVEEGTGFPRPPRGMQVAGGRHTLVAFTGKGAAQEGEYAYGLGIFAAPPGEYHAYVVWTVILKPDGEWVVESGAYVEDFNAAVRTYEKRGGVV